MSRGRSKAAKTAPKKKKKKTKRRAPVAPKPHKLHVTSTLTPAVIRDVVAVIEKGNFRIHAFAHIGVPQSLWTKWVARGRKEFRALSDGTRDLDELTLNAALVMALDRAESRVAQDLGKDVRESGDIADKRWWLERRFSRQFARNPNAVSEGEQGTEEERPRGREILLSRLLRVLGREVEDSDE